MGWTIHSNLTGGMQAETLITQGPIKLSKTFLDQSLGKEEKTVRLTTQKVNNDVRNSTSFKIDQYTIVGILTEIID